MNTRVHLLRPLTTTIAILLGGAFAEAQITWSSTPGSGTWNIATNWVGDNVPDTNTERAVFDVSNITAVNLSATTTVNKLTFSAVAPSYTFSGSQLILDVNDAGTAALTVLEALAGSGPVTFNNTVNFRDGNGNNSQPSITVGAGAVIDFNAAVTTTSNRNLQVNGNGVVNFNAGAVPNTGTGQLQQSGSGTINLFSNPAATGQIRAFGNGGSIRIHANINRALGLGVTGSLSHQGKIYLVEDGVVTSGALGTGGGSGAGTHTMDVTFGADIPGAGTATHTGVFAFNALGAGLSGSTAVMRLDVGADDTFVLTGAVTGAAGGYATPEFRKQGPGTAMLLGANTYTVPTRVAEGTLILTSAQTGNSSITVDDGATLGARTFPAGSLNTSALAVGSSTGATIRVDTYGAGTPLSPIINTGTFTPAPNTNFVIVGSNLTSGTMRLVDYTTLAGAFSSMSVTTPYRVTGTLQDNAVDGAVDLNLVVETPRWNGDVSGDWDISPDGVTGGSLNWRTLTSNAATRYTQGVSTDLVTFDDNATGVTGINLTTAIAPASTTVANDTKVYTFAGPGKLTGPGALFKNGNGTLILKNESAYDHAGGTLINAGTVQVGDGITPGVGFLPTGTTTNNGTVVLNRIDDFITPGGLAGTGTLVKSLANVASFLAAQNFGGTVNIDAGKLRFTAGGNLSGTINGAGGLVVSGGTLQMSGSSPNTYTGLTTVEAGTLQLNKTAGTTSIAGDLLFTGTGQLTLTTANQIADTSNIVYDKAANGGTIIINETVASITMVNGNDAGAQVQAQNGFVVTGLLTSHNSSVFAVASNHSGTVGGLSINGSSVIRIAANSNASTLTIGPLGIAASGGTLQVGQGANAFDAVLNLGGGVTTTGNLNITDGNFTGAQLRQINLSGDRVFDIGTFTTTTVAPDLSGVGGLIKEGQGLLTLTPASTSNYTGATIINAGTLQVNGTLSGTSVIIDGGVLAGSGSITTSVLGLDLNVNGAITPGPAIPNGIGTLTINATGTEMNVADAGPGSLQFDLGLPFSSDRINLTGGGLNIGVGVLGFDNFLFTETTLLNAGDVFTLFDTASPILGTLAADSSGPMSGGLFGQLRVSLDGTDLELAVVPEPASGALLVASLAGIVSLRRRSRNGTERGLK